MIGPAISSAAAYIARLEADRNRDRGFRKFQQEKNQMTSKNPFPMLDQSLLDAISLINQARQDVADHMRVDFGAPTPKPETPTRAREIDPSTLARSAYDVIRAADDAIEAVVLVRKDGEISFASSPGCRILDDLRKPHGAVAISRQAEEAITADPLQVAGGWQIMQNDRMEDFALAGYHYAEGPGDLRIRTNDRALLDRILVLLDVYDRKQPSRMEVAAAAYRNGYDAGKLARDPDLVERVAAKAGVDLGGNPLPKTKTFTAGEVNPALDIEVNQLLADISRELRHARAKFPADDNLTTIAMLEEAGEVAKAVLSEDAAAVRKECIQLAVMAMRIVLDGDRSTDAYRAKHHGLPPIV